VSYRESRRADGTRTRTVSLCVVPDTEDLRAATANARHVVAARRSRHRLRRGRRPGRHPPATAVRLCVEQVILVGHLSSLSVVVAIPLWGPPSLHLLMARRQCRCSGNGRSVHRHHVAAAAPVAVSAHRVVYDGVGAGAVLRGGVVDASEAVHRRRLPRLREEVVCAHVQVVELLQAVRGGDRRVVLLLLAPPAQQLRVRVVRVRGRLERDGRPGRGGVVVRAVRRQGGAVAELRGDAADVVVADGERGGGLGLPEALGGGAADGERAALEDALDLVPAHVEVGHGIEPAELDRRNVVRLRRLLLRGCKLKRRVLRLAR
jgi:hypothetical protein